MIIPPNAIHASHWSVPPIENLSRRERDSPEGVGFDLRLASVYEVSGSGMLLNETRSTSSSRLVIPADNEIYILNNNSWYLVTTEETMALPANIAGLVFPRSTLFRSGVSLHTSVVPPGYIGPLTFGLQVHISEGFSIQRLARFCHIVLFEVASGSTSYKGQWNGGRVTQDKSERQI